VIVVRDRAGQRLPGSEFEGDECDVGLLISTGVVHFCTSPSDAVSSCEFEVRNEFAGYDAETKEEEQPQCEAPPQTEFGEAFANQDRQAVCDHFGA
jgi:hypothetical protein